MATLFPRLLAADLSTATFQPFHEGVEIAPLATISGEDAPTVALLRYAPGASVPRHEHLGVETICVLSGSQADDDGLYKTGDVAINLPGSQHRVWSKEGCVVLISWTAPVRFVDGEDN